MSRVSKSLLVAFIALVIVVVLGLAFASPYIALDRMKKAADARDAETVDHYVDFPLLRDSLKDQVGQLLTRKIDTQKSGNPFALLGAMIGAALIGPLVDSYATPDGVAAILNGIPPKGTPGEKPPAPSQAPASTTTAAVALPSPPQTTAGYEGLNTFVVHYQHGAGNARYAAILHRYGLFSWKLVAIDLNG
jgi:hypothetical protein